MNVLINVPDLGLPGGVAKYCSVIRRHCNDKVSYFVVGKQNMNDSLLRKSAATVTNYFRFFKSLKSVDVVHLNPSLRPNALVRDGIFLFIAKSYGKKVVVFFHGWNDNCERSIRRFFLLPFRLVFFRADAMIVLASIFRNRLAEMGYRGKIHLETTTVEDEMFTHAASAVAEREGKPCRDSVTILYLSRIEKAKGIYEAIDAYARLQQRKAQVTLSVVGDGPELGRVRKYVADQGITGVLFKGHLSGPALREAFAEADIYLFPTWYGEGLPISILEAMVYGLPVLTRPVGGIPDFFQQGRMGFMTESREAEVFAALLERLIDDPELQQAMADYNRRYAEEHFRASIIAGRLEQIYAQLLAPGSSSRYSP